tara:strand:+ start:179 stop:388 length:210 start_codon:yes stop_codon:yes gene_type:complete
MKRYIDLVNKIFKQEIISNQPKDGFENLFYSVETNSFFSLADKNSIQSLFMMSLKQKFFFKKKRQIFTL